MKPKLIQDPSNPETFHLAIIGDEEQELATTELMCLCDFVRFPTHKGVCSKQLGAAIVQLAVDMTLPLLDVLELLEPALQELRRMVDNAKGWKQ